MVTPISWMESPPSTGDYIRIDDGVVAYFHEYHSVEINDLITKFASSYHVMDDTETVECHFVIYGNGVEVSSGYFDIIIGEINEVVRYK